MRGHIRKRGAKSRTIVVHTGLDPETGRRGQKWIRVKGSERDA